MKPGGQSLKGFAFQRDIAKRLRRWWPNAHSTGRAQAREKGKPGWAPDVDGTPFWIEAKHWKTVKMDAAFDQACLDCGLADSDKTPIAVGKSNRKPIRVMMTQWVAAWLTNIDVGFLDEEAGPVVQVEMSWDDFEQLLVCKFGPGEAKKEDSE